ncbi:MAG: hypothetical protein HQL49_13005 [Gammaproteobacteria bacterium]|nr:hypothetical protein [Gammaproteobacteria bacterium]
MEISKPVVEPLNSAVATQQSLQLQANSKVDRVRWRCGDQLWGVVREAANPESPQQRSSTVATTPAPSAASGSEIEIAGKRYEVD